MFGYNQELPSGSVMSTVEMYHNCFLSVEHFRIALAFLSSQYMSSALSTLPRYVSLGLFEGHVLCRKLNWYVAEVFE